MHFCFSSIMPRNLKNLTMSLKKHENPKQNYEDRQEKSNHFHKIHVKSKKPFTTWPVQMKNFEPNDSWNL